MGGFKIRVLSSVVLVILLGSALWVGGPYLWLLLLFASMVGLFEFYRAVRVQGLRQKKRPDLLEAVGYAACFFYYVVLYQGGKERELLYVIVASLILMMVAYVLKFPDFNSNQVFQAFFGIIYVCVMLSFVYLTRMEEGGRSTVWMIFIGSWVSDTFAYLVGILIGKHKLAPKLSPKKSVEGAIGGVAGAALAGLLFGHFWGTEGLAWAYFLMGAIGSVISQIGDLTASAIKRNHDIKDYGTLIPGQGGILDRFDSVIIMAPVVYILSQLMFNA
ncbi:MAG: phosphatidate cytidylyltransferase [Lachnospiraceae bacterium]|nr:phosphatidate cytidylyltransferase [Lachnospiraceae bacterium]